MTGLWIHTESFSTLSRDEKMAIAFSCKVKSRYRNSIVYDYSTKSLAHKINLSEYIVKKYVSKLMNMGLCFTEGNNIVFRSLNNVFVKKYRRSLLVISSGQSLSEIVSNIEWLAVIRHLAQQQYMISLKADIISTTEDVPMTLKRAKVLSKKKHLLREGFHGNMIIGMRKLSTIIGASTWKAMLLLRKKESEGCIDTRKVYHRIGQTFRRKQFDIAAGRFTWNEEQSQSFGYYFRSGNYGMRYLGTEIKLLY